jgi:hypothetical protein
VVPKVCPAGATIKKSGLAPPVFFTLKVRGCFSANTVITMAFKLCQCAQKRWIRLHRPERLAQVIKGVKFVNGIEEK